MKKHGEDVWVTPHADDEWAVKLEGQKKPVKITRSKTEAVKVARKSARKTKGSVTIQKKLVALRSGNPLLRIKEKPLVPT